MSSIPGARNQRHLQAVPTLCKSFTQPNEMPGESQPDPVPEAVGGGKVFKVKESSSQRLLTLGEGVKKAPPELTVESAPAGTLKTAYQVSRP